MSNATAARKQPSAPFEVIEVLPIYGSRDEVVGQRARRWPGLPHYETAALALKIAGCLMAEYEDAEVSLVVVPAGGRWYADAVQAPRRPREVSESEIPF